MASGKTALVTGCSPRNLSSALAIAFQGSGIRTLAAGPSQSDLAHLDHLKIETLLLDVTDEKSIASCLGHVSKLTSGRLDILVNNADTVYAMPLSDASLTECRTLFERNVFSYLAVTQAFLPLLLETRGTVVNCVSVNSVAPVPYAGVYNAAEAAAAMLTDTFRLELAPFGVKVVEIKTDVVESRYDDDRGSDPVARLPETSIFSVAQDAVEKSMNGVGVQSGALPVEVWAREVVKELLKTRPKHRIWKGKNTWSVRMARRVMPDGCSGRSMARAGVSDDVKKALRDQWVDRARAAASILS